MAVLDRSHPLVAEVNQHSQAIALLNRRVKQIPSPRDWTPREAALVSKNPLLRDLADIPGLLTRLEADREELQKKLDKVAHEARAANDKAERAKETEAASAAHSGLSDTALLETLLVARKALAEAEARFRELSREARRRNRTAKLLAKLGDLSDAERELLHTILSPKHVPSTTKVNGLG